MKHPKLFLAVVLVSASATVAAAKNDTAFAIKAAQGGIAEVDFGRLAGDSAADPKVKEFGQKMVTDHSAANDDLQAAAAKDGITLPQTASKKQHQAARRLGQLKGDAFDREYARMMVKDHEEDVALFRKEGASGQDADLKAFAQKTLPTLEAHLKMARELPGAASRK